MVTDHAKANQELLVAAKGKGEVPASRDATHKAMGVLRYRHAVGSAQEYCGQDR